MWCVRNKLLAPLALFWAAGSAWADVQMLLAEVTVNERSKGEVFLLWNGEDSFYFAAENLRQWQVQAPYPAPIQHLGKTYHPLNALEGARATYEPRTVSVDVAIPPQLLEQRRISLARSSPEPTTGTGAFLDYDWSYTNADDSALGGYVAPNFFSPIGNVRSEYVYRETPSGLGGSPYPDGWVRLDTAFTRDEPDRLRSYRIGDIVTSPGIWGSALRIGGVQIASNFGTRPNFITFPRPTVRGQAGIPSAVDLYVNSLLRHREEVDAGEFYIEDIPVVTGAGEVRVVVTDMLGREQVYVEDIYASSQLLSPGLSDYAYSVGVMREEYGNESNNYGGAVAVGVHRYGISERLTVGGLLEASRDVAVAGSAIDWALHRGGIMSGALALSAGELGSGGFWLLGYQIQDNGFRVNAQASGTTKTFDRVDVPLNGRPPKHQLLLNAGWSLGLRGSYHATLVHQAYHDRIGRDVLTLSHSRRLRGGIQFSIYSQLTRTTETDYSLGVMLSGVFDDRRSGSMFVSHERGQTRARIETQYNLPYGPGVGYRLGTTIGQESEYYGNVLGQSRTGRYSLEGRHADGETYWRAGTAGSVAWLGNRTYFAREIRDGFGVAKVGELENVRVYLENQEVGRSDRRGRVLLPALRPYEANRVRIETEDLPLHARVSTVEMVVSPYYHSGAIVEFPVNAARAALLRVSLPNDQPVPEGAIARVPGRDEHFLVTRDGSVYVTDLAGPTQLVISWHDGRCQLQVPMPQGDHPLPHLGELPCEPLRP